jgi:hypothetical protein
MIAASLALACAQAQAEVMPQETLTLPGEEVYPESMAQDAKTGRIFVGSFRSGDVFEIHKGKTAVFVPGSRDDTHSVIGIAVDSARRRLWLCNSEAGASAKSTPDSIGKSYLHVYNVDDGQLLKKIPLGGGQGGHFCNDIALSKDGTAYITDSFAPAIWKVGPDLKLQDWLVDDRFKGEGFNLNGIQLTFDEKYLLVNKMNAGKVFRIGAHDKSVVEVALDRPIEGGDGMQLVSSHSMLMVEGFGAAQPGIAKLTFNTDYTSAKIEDKIVSSAFDTPTAVRQVGSSIYVVNSGFNHLFKRDTYGPPSGPFNVVRFEEHKPTKQGAF